MDQTSPPGAARVPFAALAVALAQGLLLWWLVAGGGTGRWSITDPRLLLPLTLIVLVLPFSLQLLWPFAQQRLLQAALAAGALFVAASGALFAAAHLAPVAAVGAAAVEAGGGDDAPVAGFVLPLALCWLLAMPLLKLRLATGRWTGPYPPLFDITWRGALTLAEAALFTGAFWLLLGLAAALFELLGMEAVKDLVTDPRFAFPATTLVGTVAVHLIGASAGMVDGLLRQLLNLLKWLLPLAGLIAVAFALALLPRLPTLFAEGRKVMEATWLLWLVAVTVLLLNAAYQSGQQPPGYGRFVERALRFVPPLLAVVAATALYSLALRTHAFGLTPARYWGLVTAGAALAYAAGYTLAAWSRGAWFARIGRINVALALALLAVLLVSLTPVVDPLRLSIASQARRAVTATDAAARDGALLFLGRESGPTGRARLEALARLPDAAGGSPALRAAVPRARPPADADREPLQEWLARIDAPPADKALEPALVAALGAARAEDDSTLTSVERATLLRTDMDGDGDADALLLDTTRGHRFWLFSRDEDGAWSLTSSGAVHGSLYGLGEDAALQSAIAGGDLGAVAPRLPDLRIGKRRLILVPIATEEP